MASQWIFEGNGYSTEWGVRQAYLAAKHAELPDVEGDPVEFWKKFDVTYIENYVEPEHNQEWLEDVEQPCPKCQKAREIRDKRDEEVAQIIVTVDGMYFEGDELAQQRICRTIQVHEHDGEDLDEIKVQWVLADNSIEWVSIRQLKDALKLAVAEQSRLWIEAREDIEDLG